MKAVIYARFSSDRQREESIEGQLRECREYAKKNGITVIHEYIDRALSASKETEKRLDFLCMISDSSKGQFDTVLVWKLDRFARDRYDSAHYKHILKKNGVKVLSVTEPIADGPEGIILEGLLESMAEYYSAELSQKIHRGQTDNALKCLSNGGSIPLGYKLGENRMLEIDPMTAPIVQEIFRRYAEGETIKEIRDDLNKRGIKTSCGVEFSYASFATLLKNRKYIGEYHYRDIVIPGGVPAIVSKDVFRRVEARRKKNTLAKTAKKADELYLLTTKLFCGECGKLMAGESGTSCTGQKYRYYKCHNAKRKNGCTKRAVKKDWIENLVVEQTMKLVFDADIISRITDKIMEIQGEESYDVQILEKHLAETTRSIQNIMKAIEAGVFTETTKQRLEELEAEKASTEDAIAKARIESPIVSREEISFYLSRFRNTDIADEHSRQRLIDCFVNAVYVYDDRIVLTFNYKDATKTITLDEVNSSDLKVSRPPGNPH